MIYNIINVYTNLIWYNSMLIQPHQTTVMVLTKHVTVIC